MYTATMLFLGLAVCSFAGVICLALAKREKAANANPMSQNEKMIWKQIKTVMRELHSRYESTETPKQKMLRSWAGTFAFCAGICLIGIVLEVKYRHPVNAKNVVAAFVSDTHVSVPQTAPKHQTKVQTQRGVQPQRKTHAEENAHMNNTQRQSTTKLLPATQPTK